jgi:hypothetical protein
MLIATSFSIDGVPSFLFDVLGEYIVMIHKPSDAGHVDRARGHAGLIAGHAVILT